MQSVFLLIVNLVLILLRYLRECDNCPDGVCDEPIAQAEQLKADLSKPNVSVGLFDLLRFLRCFPMDRVVAVGKRIVALVRDCQRCPDGECTFFDILSCLDLNELVEIVKEIISIIQDSTICDDSSNGEITLGQATGK